MDSNCSYQEKRRQAVDVVLKRMRNQVLGEGVAETIQNDGAVDGRCDVVGPVGLEPTAKAL